MAADSKSVELRIKALLDGKKNLQDTVDALKKITEAQDDQINAAKRGEVSLGALERGYKDLLDVVRSLESQNRLIVNLEAQSRALGEIEVRVNEARQAHTAFYDVIQKGGAATKEQENTLSRLANAVKRAEAAQQKQADRVAATTEKLAGYGIEAANVAGAQERIATALDSVTIALRKQDSAMQTVEKDARAYREAQAAAAAREKELAQLQRQRAEFVMSMQAQRRAEMDQERASLALKQQEIEKTIALRVALQQQAAQIEATARGYATLARSTASVQFPSISGSIKGVFDPASQQAKSVASIEEMVSKLESRAKSAAGPVKDYAAAVNEMKVAQRGITDMAAQIDAFQRQMVAVRGARQEYVEARAAVARLVEAMRSGTAGENFTRDLSAANSRLKAASETMGQQSTRARELRDALRAAGVQTSDLARVTDQLQQAATRSVSATNSLSGAVSRYGVAVDDAEKKKRKFNEGSRQSLDIMQRMRGQVLSLVAAYGGLQGAISLATATFDTVRNQAKVESRLGMVFDGDTGRAKEEIAYLKQKSDELGVSFKVASDSYSRFAVAAKGSGSNIETIRYVFENVTKAAVKAGLSNEEYEGTLRALEQMMSKGVIQAEELKGQLGDRLPGAIAAAAKGMGITIAEMLKKMEQGGVSAAYVVNLSRELGNEANKVVDTAATNVIKAAARFENARTEFMQALAERGVMEAFSDFLKKLTEFLRSERGEKAVRVLAAAFNGLIGALSWVVDHIELVAGALTVFVGLKAWGMISVFVGNFTLMAREIGAVVAPLARLGTSMTAVGGFIGTVAQAVGGLTVAFKLLGRSIPLLGAALTAYELYKGVKGLYDKDVPGGGATQKNSDLVNQIPTATFASESKPTSTGEVEFVSKDQGRMDALKRELDKADKRLKDEEQSALARKNKNNLKARLDLVEAQYAEQIAAANSIENAKMREEAVAEIQKRVEKDKANERIKYANEMASTDKTSANRRITLAQEVARELKNIEANLEKSETMGDPTSSFADRLKARLKEIEFAYKELQTKIDKLSKVDPKAGADAQKKLNAFIGERKAIEERKVSLEELARLEKELADIQTEKNLKIEQQNELYKQGNISQSEYVDNVNNLTTEYSTKVRDSALAVRMFASSVKDAIGERAFTVLITKVDTLVAGINAARENLQRGITEGENKLDDLVKKRDRELKRVDANERAGVYGTGTTQAADARNEINARYNPQIAGTSTQLLSSIDQMKAELGPNANQETVANLDNLRAKVEEIALAANKVKTEFGGIEEKSAELAGGTLNSSLDAMGNAFQDIVMGQKSAKEGMKALADATKQAIAGMLKDMALYIIKLMIIKALESSGNPYASAVAGAMKSSAGIKHTGGSAGSPGGGTRSIHPAYFASAQRLHNGGIPGLNNNEVPTVLLKNEEVLTRDDPRHALNGGKQQQGNNRFVLVDDRSRVHEAMATADGEKVTIQHIKANLPTIRQMLR